MALLDLVGRRWTLRVMWELHTARPLPLTFRALQDRCAAMSSSVLNRRLGDLRNAGLVAREPSGYVLTPMGSDLVGLLAPLDTWALRWSAEVAVPSAENTKSDISSSTGGSMPKGYWVSVYPTIEDPESLDVYNELAGLAVAAAGGRVLASIGSRVDAHEAGIAERVVLIEFDSFEQAVAARASAAYQEALAQLPDGFDRDFRIIEGLDGL